MSNEEAVRLVNHRGIQAAISLALGAIEKRGATAVDLRAYRCLLEELVIAVVAPSEITQDPRANTITTILQVAARTLPARRPEVANLRGQKIVERDDAGLVVRVLEF